MIRYIFALITPVLLLASCQVTEGTEREPMDVGKYIARRATSYYLEMLQDYFDYAVVADWYLQTEDEELKEEIHNRFMPDYDIVMEDGIVRFQYDHSWNSNNNPRTYREYVTDDKLLSEGGEWKIVGSELTAVVIKATDGVYSFTTSSKYHENTFTISLLEHNINSGISYMVEGWLNVTNNDYDNLEDSDVMLATEITAPLHYMSNSYNHNYFDEGTMDIVCDDKRIDRCDEVTVTFKTYNSAEVVYLGQREVWEY